jgi:AraC-like DNA-binding protein
MPNRQKRLKSPSQDWGRDAFSPAPPEILRAFKSFKPFHSIIHYYVDLSCFLIPSPRAQGWWALNRRKRPISFSEVEAKYGSYGGRYRFIQDCFQRVKREGRTVCGERFGFRDLFVPVLKKENLLGYLQAGTFAGSEMTAELLKQSWKEMSGLEASPTQPEYRDFTRAVLEMPVLEGPLLPAYQECLEIFGGLLTEEVDAVAAEEKLQQRLTKVIAKGLPHSYWMDWALGRSSTEPTPFWSRRMEEWDWIRDEIGISQVPTTVLAVMPQRPGRRTSDWSEDMLRIYRLQRRSFKFAQTLPQTVGGKLENYGAVFVTSADPSEPKLKRRRQIEAVAEKIREFAEREMEGPVWVGAGAAVAPGESLVPSYHQALLALHLGGDSKKDILFFDGKKKGIETRGFLELRQTQTELNEAFVSAPPSEVDALEGRFLKETLSLSFQNPYETRRHFQYTLDRLMDTVEKQMGLGKKQSNQLREKLVRSLETTATLQEMVTVFEDAVAELRRFTERPSSLDETQSLEKARNYLEQRFREPLKTARLARLAGVSLSTFSRRFKKMAGMGVEAYVQNLRVTEAKKLLRSTRYSVSQIGRACGFKSGSYFIHLFKKKTGFSPEKYRDQISPV